MKQKKITIPAKDSTDITVYQWLPETECKAVIHIVHGMEEHAERYLWFAGKLTAEGYGVYAHDLRGHGKSAIEKESLGCLGTQITFVDLISDIYMVNKEIRKTFPKVPFVLFGHSFGSVLSVRYAECHGNTLDGIMLTGISIPSPILLRFGKIITNFIIKKHGERYQSTLVNNLAFGSYNKPFEPKRTEFDWLTRENKIVDSYVADPLCGFICSCGFFITLSDLFLTAYKKKNLLKIPSTLPFFIGSGAMDPVGNLGKDIKGMYHMLKKAGIKDIAQKVYDGARHELVNEINREEITEDFITWLKSKY